MEFHRFPIVFILAGLGVGSIAPEGPGVVALAAALALAGVIALFAVVKPDSIGVFALTLAALPAGASLATVARFEYSRLALPTPLRNFTGIVQIEGTIATEPQTVDSEERFDLISRAVTAHGEKRHYSGRVRVFVRGSPGTEALDSARLVKGDVIRAWVELRPPEPVRSPGGFDQEGWAMREGINVFATCKNARLLELVSRPAPATPFLDRLREALRESWLLVPDATNRAVTASMVLGDEGALDSSTREDFRSAGLLHILVVSGSQVVTLMFALRRVLPMKLRISWSGFVVETIVLVGYCTLAGGGSSLLRATTMAVAYALSVRIDLQRASVNSLSAAALLLLVARPLDASDPGAQMSFAAALALMTLAGPLVAALKSVRVPGVIAEVAAAALVASLATAPLTLVHFHRVSIIGILANLFAAPLAALLLYASLVTAMLNTVSSIGAEVAGLLCNGLAASLRLLAHSAAAIDPDWRGPTPPAALWVLLLCLVASGRRRRILAFASVLSALSLSGLTRGDGRVHFWFLDVGQGDSILIETPRGHAIVVDAGPAFQGYDAGERVVAPALWSLGYRRLDFMAVTHRHSDHEGGAPFLARHFDVGRIVVNDISKTVGPWSPEIVGTGARWTLDDVSLRVLSPDSLRLSSSRDENANSLVIEVRFGSTTALLLGDADAGAESALDLRGQWFDVVKAAHHGASTSSSEALVRETHPRIVVISVGARNRFGHPNQKIVARWRVAGARILRTDVDRTVHLVSDGTTVRP